MKYVVISPVRDEEEHLPGTIASMRAQTVVPSRWVVVDDGSTDGTAAIVDAAAREVPWIRAVHRGNRGFRAAGSGVVEAFYAGYEALDVDDWDFLVKLDGDLVFEDTYFARCLEKFRERPDLGIGGGVIFNPVGDAWELERHPRFHVRGATKIYRRACWDAIEGLERAPGWDTIDEVKANMFGWSTFSFDDVRLEQTRFTGDAAGQWKNWVKNGKASYYVGYHPVFLSLKALRRMVGHAPVKSGLGLLWGYYGAMLRRGPRVDDPRLRKYVRSQQMRKLTGRSSIWR